jgi:hypothetical protein
MNDIEASKKVEATPKVKRMFSWSDASSPAIAG